MLPFQVILVMYEVFFSRSVELLDTRFQVVCFCVSVSCSLSVKKPLYHSEWCLRDGHRRRCLGG